MYYKYSKTIMILTSKIAAVKSINNIKNIMKKILKKIASTLKSKTI